MALQKIAQSRQITATIRLEEDTAMADQKAAFIQASADNVVNDTLECVFSKDRGFHEFQKSAEAASAGANLWCVVPRSQYRARRIQCGRRSWG